MWCLHYAGGRGVRIAGVPMPKDEKSLGHLIIPHFEIIQQTNMWGGRGGGVFPLYYVPSIPSHPCFDMGKWLTAADTVHQPDHWYRAPFILGFNVLKCSKHLLTPMLQNIMSSYWSAGGLKCLRTVSTLDYFYSSSSLPILHYAWEGFENHLLLFSPFLSSNLSISSSSFWSPAEQVLAL